MERKRICFVVAYTGTARSFLKDHIKALSQDYDVYLVADLSADPDFMLDGLIEVHHVAIKRNISIANDLKAVGKLTSYFRKMHFDAVHSVTPKAGLITALSARLTGIHHRTHIFTGQVWITRKGLMRTLLKQIDRLIVMLDNHILVDGNSQRRFLIHESVVSDSGSMVLGDGSISGVNTERFRPSIKTRNKIRHDLGITADKIVFVFMGRLNRDKGLYELLSAFSRLTEVRENVFLLLFGNDEESVSSHFTEYANLTTDNFLYYGVTLEPQNMLQAGDVFVLPTYREGFGSSVIEAACLGLPTITSDAYGVLDASVSGETGLRCHVGDVDSLYEAMLILADDESLRQKMGNAGRHRVLNKFAGDVVVNHWKDFYNRLLS